MSRYTYICRLKLWFYRIIDILLLFSPVLVYVFMALTKDGVTVTGRISVVGTVCIALILAVFNVIAQKRLRCPIWIILLGLYIAIKEILLPLIIILAIVTVIDDLILTPLISYYRTKVIANKAIDERVREDGDIQGK